MKRTLRRWIALLAIGSIAFAQVAAAASVCVSGGAGGFRAPASMDASATATGGHCGDRAVTPATPSANLCEVHCTDGVSSAAAVDLPPLALVSLPVPLLPVAALPAGFGPDHALAAALAAGPPPQLLFVRFLI